MFSSIRTGYSPLNIRTEILAGLTVAMTMIPESLSFAILAGLSPLSGLYAAFIMGLITSVLGGRPGLVSGGAGATIIVLISLMKSHGTEYIFATVALAGVIQLLVGFFKLGKFVRLVPESVMYGFVNGLAVVIFMSQLTQFKKEVNGQSVWLQGQELYTMAGLVVLTLITVLLASRFLKKIPSALLGIIVVFAVTLIFQIPTKSIKDIADISGGFPAFHIPQVPFSWQTFMTILPYAGIMACVGLIESLLTLNVVDEYTNTRGNTNQECLAQGTANLANGFFAGMGGCAMIAQTFVNITSGSRTRVSAIISSLVILIIIMYASPFIEKIPMAALTGVMMIVAIKTFNWGSVKIFNRMPLPDIVVMIIVTFVTIILHNLALAVLIGVVISALVFAWENAVRIRARKYIDHQGIKHYEIYGPLFFGSTKVFLDKFDVENDPETVIVNFQDSRISDMSAIETIHKLSKKYKEANKTLVLKYLNPDSIKLLKNAEAIIEVNIDDDPTYKIPVN